MSTESPQQVPHFELNWGKTLIRRKPYCWFTFQAANQQVIVHSEIYTGPDARRSALNGIAVIRHGSPGAPVIDTRTGATIIS